MDAFWIIVALLLLAAPAWAQEDPLDRARAAYAAGNYEEEVAILRPLAKAGDAEAQYNLGVMYDQGRGVEQDDAQAVEWYRKAAEQGVPEAQYDLGVMYAEGQGVPQDDAQAVDWWRKAAERGFAKAQYNLGVLYHEGRGVPQDHVQAYIWFTLAAAQGDEDAVHNRDVAARKMTPEALKGAQARVGALQAEIAARRGQGTP